LSDGKSLPTGGHIVTIFIIKPPPVSSLGQSRKNIVAFRPSLGFSYRVGLIVLHLGYKVENKWPATLGVGSPAFFCPNFARWCELNYGKLTVMDPCTWRGSERPMVRLDDRINVNRAIALQKCVKKDIMSVSLIAFSSNGSAPLVGFHQKLSLSIISQTQFGVFRYWQWCNYG